MIHPVVDENSSTKTEKRNLSVCARYQNGLFLPGNYYYYLLLNSVCKTLHIHKEMLSQIQVHVHVYNQLLENMSAPCKCKHIQQKFYGYFAYRKSIVIYSPAFCPLVLFFEPECNRRLNEIRPLVFVVTCLCTFQLYAYVNFIKARFREGSGGLVSWRWTSSCWGGTACPALTSSP